MSRPFPIGVQLLIVLALGGATAWGWHNQQQVRAWLPLAQAQTEPAPGARRDRTPSGAPVIVAPVRVERDTLTLEAVGTGFAIRSVMLRSEASGIVTASGIEAGRAFREGDVLMRLDDRDERLAMRLAKVGFDEADRNRNRLTRLQQSGATAATNLDEALTATEVARIELERTRDAVLDRVLLAPFDDVSGLPAVEPGDRIEQGDAVASFDDRRTLLVEFDLPQALLGRVSQGLSVSAQTPSVPDRTFTGRVTAIDSRVNAGNRAARVRVGIPNDGDVLRPGVSFTVSLVLEGAAYPVVPELALQFSRGSLYAWRIVDGAARKVEVTMVRRLGGTVLVDGDLSAGDSVVVEGTQRLSEGRAVEVLDDGGAGS